jgi:hypothetical protein
VSKTNVTAPAPRVAYQRIELGTRHHEAPVTTLAGPDEAVAPVEVLSEGADDAEDEEVELEDVEL